MTLLIQCALTLFALAGLAVIVATKGEKLAAVGLAIALWVALCYTAFMLGFVSAWWELAR